MKCLVAHVPLDNQTGLMRLETQNGDYGLLALDSALGYCRDRRQQQPESVKYAEFAAFAVFRAFAPLPVLWVGGGVRIGNLGGGNPFAKIAASLAGPSAESP